MLYGGSLQSGIVILFHIFLQIDHVSSYSYLTYNQRSEIYRKDLG